MIKDDLPTKRFKKKDDAHILEQARKDIDSWFSYWGNNITRARDNIYFIFVDQWDEHSRNSRERKRKAVLQFNRLYTHITQIIGEQRQNTPNIKVRAKSPNVSQEEVDLRENIIRQIMYESKSDIVSQTAFRNALCGGFGAIQIDIDYESSKSFDLFPKILPVEDPTQVFFDPSAKSYDKSDGRFCGKYITMREDEFKEKYPDVTNFSSFDNNKWGAIWENYGNEKHITIADYYVKEYYQDIIVKLSDGRVVTKREADFLIKEDEINRAQNSVIYGDDIGGQLLNTDPLQKIDSRETNLYRIIHYKLIKNQILEKSEWPCDDLPFKYVDGDSSYIEGEQRTRSFIDSAKDAQRLLNYSGSEMAENIVNATRSQWIGTAENIARNQEVWKNPDLWQSILIAERDKHGQLPQKVPASPMPPALLEQYRICEESIPHNLGRYQANLGAPSNEQSGVAVFNRAQQGNSSSFVYFDNLNRAIESTACTLLKLLPTIFDGTRNITTRTIDGEQKTVKINQPTVNGIIANEIKEGNYDIELIVGPNYEIQKAQALEQLLSLARIDPQSTPLLMDLIAANIDVKNMPQLVERMKSRVPPDILAKEKGEPPPPPEPNPQEELVNQMMKNKMTEQKLKEKQLQQNEQKIALDHEQALMKYDAQNSKAATEIKKAELEYKRAVGENFKHYLKNLNNV